MKTRLGVLASLALVVGLSFSDRAVAEDAAAASKAKDATPTDSDIRTVDLLEAMNNRSISAFAKGTGDGRMSISITNRTKKPLRVVLPPGIVAQGATGQFGGMGGMGGGMGGMGGGMGGMGGGMGGMGGGMGGMGGRGGMGGGGMRGGGTMPPTMGLMMLSRLIMYFCGDYDSWDKRAAMMAGGMMGGMGGGMMGGMGGMGGGMGGMGGGMRSVPPNSLPFADLKPAQTRVLPTRVVVLTPPDSEGSINFPPDGETLELGRISDINEDKRVQKALKRLSAEKVSRPVAQLVMWKLSAGLDWAKIRELSSGWANDYELALAKDFVEHLDSRSDVDPGQLLFEFDSSVPEGATVTRQLADTLNGQIVLGLTARIGVPETPEGPAVACRVRIGSSDAIVQVAGSSPSGQGWTSLGKFSVPIARKTDQTIDAPKTLDQITEGVLGRLVRGQLIRGPREKGKLTYRLRIDNASPLILNAIAAVGNASKEDAIPRILSDISLPPRKSLTVPASEEVVNQLGLKKGIRVVAVDLSGI